MTSGIDNLIGREFGGIGDGEEEEEEEEEKQKQKKGEPTEEEKEFLRQNGVRSNDNSNGEANGNNNQVDCLKDLNRYITDHDYVEFSIRTIKKTVKFEDVLVRQIMFTGLSKDSTNPINLAVLAPTSEGKTHAVFQTVRIFPKHQVWKVGSMSQS